MSKQYKEAWALVRTDLIRFKWGVVFTLLFSVYMSATSLLLTNHLLNENEEKLRFLSGLLDFIYLVTLPNFGFFFSRRSMRYLQEDSYTKWMMKLRTLPITIHTIALSRIMLMTVAFALNMFIFILIQATFSTELRAELSPVSIAAYTLMLTALAIMINLIYIMMELSYNGRKYMKSIFITLGIITVISIFIALSGGSLVLTVIHVAKYYPWLSAILALGVIACALMLGITGARNRIRKRDIV
ncbi:hypothetical protein [Aneurinibacillus aneurinilyticus]|uniref:ABC transporter permease n=2 Tax=Aneurinibacillus aneurinilyticus TaxID=1391 RepID=A0A848CWM5_ANEAE|nr:hypothetical protein [Aneurinibacillus aneurinilyticus]ERI09533.1 hypothetical protein HMPREF0083_02374 [Aneurinibacillus aneurinilyticus ATCC 12856]MCI1695726.1 hypothetical protein [Aneurinibacillus aneurinilyticus]MED0706700.1 hypothetical protein [Aneurinibacillus aneurinilyticus]MED0722574.1 hypothetical protein [Aneurinibacillus aneurinilyticus]MED0734252.1 hypothetical protein [Aneurinibacillus aneurinilyticus]